MDLKVFLRYLRQAGNYCTISTLIILLILAQVITSSFDYWAGYWNKLEDLRNNIKSNISHTEERIYVLPFLEYDETGLLTTIDSIYIYAFLLALCLITNLLRASMFIIICTIAGKNLHNTMFSNLLHANMKFFDSNPSGKYCFRFQNMSIRYFSR